MANKKVNSDEKLQNTDVNLFDVLAALDRKDYNYYDRLTEEQKRKIVPYMLVHWMSAVKSNGNVGQYYLLSTNEHANKHLFNEFVAKHPKVQWLMLCAISPNVGKQFHQYLPNIRERVSKYREAASLSEMKEYYKKIYPNVNDENITLLSKTFVEEQKRKVYLSTVYPHMKLVDIETLNQLITDDDIKRYEADRGNG